MGTMNHLWIMLGGALLAFAWLLLILLVQNPYAATDRSHKSHNRSASSKPERYIDNNSKSFKGNGYQDGANKLPDQTR